MNSELIGTGDKLLMWDKNNVPVRVDFGTGEVEVECEGNILPQALASEESRRLFVSIVEKIDAKVWAMAFVVACN